MDLFKNQPKNCDEEEDCCQFALQLSSASVLPMVLKTVIELGVLEIIGRAGLGAQLSASEIASSLPTKNPQATLMLERMLRLLASYSVLTNSLNYSENGEVQRFYGLGPVCKYFIGNNHGASLAPFLHLIQDKAIMESWYHLKDAVLEGGLPFTKAHDLNATDYLKKDSRFANLFKQYSVGNNVTTMKKILDNYKGFENLKELVDVGGGDGSVLNMIVSTYPSIKGINFDTPPVIEKAPFYPGVEHVAGDMFESVPKSNTIFMKCILHGWDDESCLKLLRNCYKALPDDGMVVAVEYVIPTTSESISRNKNIILYDAFMMTIHALKQKTLEEYEVIAKEAGFSGVKLICYACNYSLLEIYKN